jgi:hypothetical protein
MQPSPSPQLICSFAVCGSIRLRFDKRRAHALLALDNDPLRSIRSEDLEQVITTTTATHLLQTREGAQIVRHKVDLSTNALLVQSSDVVFPLN